MLDSFVYSPLAWQGNNIDNTHRRTWDRGEFSEKAEERELVVREPLYKSWKWLLDQQTSDLKLHIDPAEESKHAP